MVFSRDHPYKPSLEIYQKNNCDVSLVWHIDIYSNFDHQILIVDATSGDILSNEINSSYSEVNSDTKGSHKSSIEAEVNYINRSLTCDGIDGITIFESTGIACGQSNESDIVSMGGTEICPGEENAQVDALYIQLVKAKDAIENLTGKDLNDINVSSNCTGGSSSITARKFILGIRFGFSSSIISLSSTDLASFGASYDVIVHELFHIYQFTDVDEGLLPEVEEAWADIVGTYLQSLCQPGGVDWVIGNAVTPVRDLSNPANFTCYDQIPPSNTPPFGIITDHDRSEPISHLFYLLAVGDSDLGITGLGLETAFNLMQDAFNMGAGIGEFGVRNIYFNVIELAKELFNSPDDRCDERILNIEKAFETVCIGFPNSTCSFSIGGDREPCIENGVCLRIDGDAASSDTHFFWNYPLQWTVSGLNGGDRGNTPCFNFPIYPYYPQYFEVCARTSSDLLDSNNKKRCVTIKLLDCNGDYPTCEEFFGNVVQNDVKTRSSEGEFKNIKYTNSIIVYDILGHILYNGIEQNFERTNYLGKLILISRFDVNGNIYTEKSFILN